MKRYLAVFNSDKINKYGYKFDLEALESILSQTWEIGSPSFLSHDCHRIAAWNKSLSLYIEPGLAFLTGITFIPENEKDWESIVDQVQHYLSKYIDKVIRPKRSEFRKRLSPYYSSSIEECMPDCAAVKDTNLAINIFPDIFYERDKDGLVPLASLETLVPGVYQRDGLLFFAHKYFRRSFSVLNSLNHEFLKLLQQINTENPDLEIRIALDTDMVGLADTFRSKIELEYWWGPKFNDNLNEIPLGITRHNSDEKNNLFHGISQTEFWWHSQNGIKTLEIEELRDIPSYGVGSDYFGCRYIHSMLRKPGHLDGAIRMYDLESMIERIDGNIQSFGRHSSYTKLWRIDGDLDVSTWKELITHYYRDNYLVGEYLGGEDKSEHIRPHIVDLGACNKPISEYVPCNIGSGEGIRVSISYHDKIEVCYDHPSIRPLDYLSLDSLELNYAEYQTIEIIKIIRTMGQQIDYPDNLCFISFDDLVVNFPLICHTGLNSVLLAEKTLSIIRRICESWNSLKDDRIVTYSIGVQYPEANVYFSVAGHVNDLCIWHKRHQIGFPKHYSMLADFCQNIYRFISNEFPKQYDFPPLKDIHQNTGLLKFERRFLGPNEYDIRYDEEQGSVICDISFPKEQKQLLESGDLQVACAYQIQNSECSICKKSYFSCLCSKISNPKLIETITDASIIGAFWTDRKA